ncbi:MAG: XisI protein [Gammaproteobacteria bacterium]|nr:XisI protein [Gammaproteobacteria bacterium]
MVVEIFQKIINFPNPGRSIVRLLGFREWRGHAFISGFHGCVLHIDIKNGKIWIQHDGTEIGMADERVKPGVPKEDIVLGFQAPYRRPYTEFAVA